MTFAPDRDAPDWLLEGETRRRLVGTLAIAGLSVLALRPTRTDLGPGRYL